MLQQCIDENAHTALDQTEYRKRYDALADRFDRARERLDETGRQIMEKQARREGIERFLAELEKLDGVPMEFDEDSWYSLVEYVTVFTKQDIRFTFKNGMEVQV